MKDGGSQARVRVGQRVLGVGLDPVVRARGLPQAGAEIGHYILIRRLAHGNMGVVYEAVDRDLQRRVALKMLRNDLDVTAEDRQRFRIESSAMARLRHPGIVPVYEVGSHEGIDYFTMELIEGVGFDVWLRAAHRTYRERVAIVLQIARALAHAHQQDIVHRDLKPANVLVDEEGVARLTDFGLARSLHAQIRLTDPGRTVGTPAYMSPEQAQGLPVDARCDIWGCGAILYEALTGRPPYLGESTYTVMSAVVSDAPQPPRRVDRSIPRDLEAVTLQCLEKSVEQRYASATHLADDLERWLNGEQVQARRVGALQRLARRLRKQPIATALTALCLVLALASGTYWTLEQEWSHARWIPLAHMDFRTGAGIEGVYLGRDLVSPPPSGGWTRDAEGLHPVPEEWLWLDSLHVAGDVRITVVVHMDHPDGLEICVDSRREMLAQPGWVPTGYSCQFAGYGGTVDLISRNPQPRESDINTAVDSAWRSGADQTVVVERRGERLTLSVDGRVSLEDEDALPLTGENLNGIGLHTYAKGCVLRSLTVERLALPEKASPVIVGDALVQAGDFPEAIASYLAIARDHPGGATAEQALTKAYFAAMRAPNTDPALVASIRHDLDRAFPHGRFASRVLELDALHDWSTGAFGRALALLPTIYNLDANSHAALRLLSAHRPHLTDEQGASLLHWVHATNGVHDLDLSRMQLSSIGEISGMHLRRLVVADNHLTSLRPLAGAALEDLTCSHNQIQDLEPLAGMPLTHLDASGNLIASVQALASCRALTNLSLRDNAITALGALSSLPLRQLDASGNPLSSAPLPGRQLSALVLEECGLLDVRELAGSQLHELSLASNRLRDISPLAGVPLERLDIGQNRVTDLSPLAHSTRLASLLIAGNLITDLRPIAHPQLRMLLCDDNRIHDLSPLAGIHLQSLRCAGNPLTSLEPLVEAPPEEFIYDDGNFPLDEIERAAAHWQRDGQVQLARQARTLIAARHGDIAALLLNAERDLGHAYLLIPMAVSWEDASARCQALGGHLVTIGSREEERVVEQACQGVDAWIGLRLTGEETRWEDGSPLTFQAFPYADLRRVSGPVHLLPNLHQWFVRPPSCQRLPFLIEWDDLHP